MPDHGPRGRRGEIASPVITDVLFALIVACTFSRNAAHSRLQMTRSGFRFGIEHYSAQLSYILLN